MDLMCKNKEGHFIRFELMKDSLFILGIVAGCIMGLVGLFLMCHPKLGKHPYNLIGLACILHSIYLFSVEWLDKVLCLNRDYGILCR